ncbi:Hypothetical protein, putative [Bodo saltans]|uniref:Uncharacterized protein n=1 Tax=Bodo saltans TaxID=75058 RepID=A0A0S4IZI7_BODSA|nr:Hypothetical protein, putative [Bodo saltans]|eukprot:CUF91857.1 Hypothetical protein, putative [Bodo saltans]
MSQSPSPFFQTVAPTQRQEDLLLNSHILAYESLVGTLTKQVLAQQEQLSELRSVLLSNQTTSSSASVFNTSHPQQQYEPQQYEQRRDPSAGLVASPAPSQHQTPSVRYDEELFRRLEPLISQSLAEHFYHAEERIAASLADRIRRITKEHVMRSVDREIRHVMRDAVVESCAQQVMSSSSLSRGENQQRSALVRDPAAAVQRAEHKQRHTASSDVVASTTRKKSSRSGSSTKHKASHRSPSHDVVDRVHDDDKDNSIMNHVRERQRLLESVARRQEGSSRNDDDSTLDRRAHDSSITGYDASAPPPNTTIQRHHRVSTEEYELKRNSENRLLQEMDHLRAKLEDLERRSSGGNASSRPLERDGYSSQKTHRDTYSHDRKNGKKANHHHQHYHHEDSVNHHSVSHNSSYASNVPRGVAMLDESSRRSGLKNRSTSSSSESGSSSTHSSSVHRRFSGTSVPREQDSLRNVDRDVDHLMQAFRDLSRNSL